MGLKDRVARAEGGEPDDAPVCDVCGQSYRYIATFDAFDDPDNPTYRSGRAPCEACDADRLAWGREHGVVLKITYEKAPTREQIAASRMERGLPSLGWPEGRND
jgi:hypothetical protein